MKISTQNNEEPKIEFLFNSYKVSLKEYGYRWLRKSKQKKFLIN